MKRLLFIIFVLSAVASFAQPKFNINLNQIKNINIRPTNVAGHVLTWNGSKWVDSLMSGGSSYTNGFAIDISGGVISVDTAASDIHTVPYLDTRYLQVSSALQDILTVNNNTTIPINGSDYHVWPTYTGSRYTSDWVSSLSSTGNGVNAEGALILRANSTGDGNIVTLVPRADLSQDVTLRLPNTGNLEDTIPTLSEVRSMMGGGGGSMVYPGAGIPISTGSAWGTSITDNSSNWNTAYTDRLKWDGGSTGLNATTAKASLGLVIGTDVQAYSASLEAFAALSGTGYPKKTGTTTWALDNTSMGNQYYANTYYQSYDTTVRAANDSTLQFKAIGDTVGSNKLSFTKVVTDSTIKRVYDVVPANIDRNALGGSAVTIANGGTNNGSLSVTQGTVYYGDGSKLVGLAPGTNGQVLTTQGAGANPTWTTPSAGGGGADPILSVYQGLGSAIKAATVGVNYQADGSFTTYTLTDGRVQYVAIYLPTAATITGVGFYMRTQGSYTADQTNQVGLFTYNSATGTMTRVAASANNGNLWKAASNTWVKEPFTSTYSASEGLYFIGFVYNSSAQTTAPIISAGRAVNQSNEVTLDFTNSATISGRKTGNSLPSSQTMVGLDAPTPERPYVFIY